MSDLAKDNCIILNKCIYGFVEAACQYSKKAVEILKSSTFFEGSIDPFLYVKKGTNGIVHIALYLDDNLMVGDMAAIDDAIEAFKSKGLELKIMEGL